MANMIGVIGLGRMGMAIAIRLINAGFSVLGFDTDENKRKEAMYHGIVCIAHLADLASYRCSILWIMVPAGKPVDMVLEEIRPYQEQGDIVIDGGNSFFKDSVIRYEKLKQAGIHFLDCGTSGGVHGEKIGFCLMVGGDQNAFEQVRPFFSAIATHNGCRYLGPSGAGHYIKMVHNGIEYSLLQAYAEGFHLLKDGEYKNLNLHAIADLWNHGSIIRSWITELSISVFENEKRFETISGSIGENATGKWMKQCANEYNIPVKLLEESLSIRAWSRETGGNYGTKVVALLRNTFGGHEVKKE